MNSLGFDKAPSQTRVVVAMSGGVDSSVVAAMLKQEGYDVIGITLQLYDHGQALAKKGACCAGADIYDARCVAGKIGIPHYVLDYESRFSQSVIDDFADSYLKGETPIPCVRCNQKVKFRDLLEAAKELGAEALATGHYVKRVGGTKNSELHRAADATRDQSYFLFATTQGQLDYLRFPLGDLPKTRTREIALELNLPVAQKPDSMDICFVPGGRYADVVKKLRPEAMVAGDIVHENGSVLGRHEGIAHFTIGQRKGLNLQSRDGENRAPLFVVGLDAKNARVIVAEHSALAVQSIVLRETNWLGAHPAGQKTVSVKYRSTMESIPATLHMRDDGLTEVIFDDLQFGVARGQACVVFDDSKVLGGGWIDQTIRQTAPVHATPLLHAAAE